MTSRLFESSSVVGWLPDETLYSLVSRQHVVAGNTSHSTTCRQMFGHPQRGSAHDFPSRVDELVTRTQGTLGSARQIIECHTLLPFYLRFSEPVVAENAIAALRGNGIGSLKFTLGLLTGGFRANHPLKACRECMVEDMHRHQVPYWHVEHQVPGVWVCLQHEAVLMEANVKATGVHRFLWHIPASELLQHAFQGPPPSELRQLAEVAGQLHRARGRHFELSRVRVTYRLRAAELGYGKGFMSMRLGAMAKDYVAMTSSLRVVPEFRPLPQDAETAYDQLAKMLGPRCSSHPIRHASLISWLFEDYAAFAAAYDQCPGVTEQGEGDRPSPTRDPRRAAIAKALKREKETVTAISRRLGVDVTTVMAVRAQLYPETPVSRRPKLLIESKRRLLVDALALGQRKQDAAKAAGTSISTVTRVLRTEPGLQDRWHTARTEAAREVARSTWQRIVGGNPLLGVKALRLVEPATYAWLYRNDRAWLDAHKPSDSRLLTAAAPRVQWDVRDRYLALSVAKVAAELGADAPGRTLALWQIYQQLPDLKAKLGHLDRLPLTAAALNRCTMRIRR